MTRLVSVGGLGAHGFTVQGAGQNDFAGWSVASAGDVNGDGFDDVIIGAPYGDGINTNQGNSYVIYGHPGGLGNIDLAHLSQSQGFVIQGTRYGGLSVSGAGDVNGDGFDDVVIATDTGDRFGDGTATAYVVLGKANQGPVDLSHLAASDGFGIGVTVNAYYATFALDVASAGDVNGDGFDDIIIGSQYANGDKGAAYVVFGKAGSFANVDVSNLSASQGFAILGAVKDDMTGFRVSGAGDINGDGFDDIIIGASGGDSGGNNSGQAYVIFGKANGFTTIDLANLPASAGFLIQGDSANDFTGSSVSRAGDVNADGFDDLLVGASGDDNVGGIAAGAVYVILGKAGGFGTIDLTNSGSAGYLIHGATPGANLGYSVSNAGDVNRDGFDDLLVASSNPTASVYVIYGKAGPLGNIDLANLPASAGFVVQGTGIGFAIAAAGDFSGDGFTDIILGAWSLALSGVPTGGAYVVLGSGPAAFAAADFDGDSRDDLFWRNDDGSVTDWLGSINGGFAGNWNNFHNNPGSDWHVAGTGDFNGDGKSDILWRAEDGTTTNWLGTASGGFSGNWDNFHNNPTNGWYVAGTGDFSGDGKTDILWRSDDGTTTTWLGTASGGFTGNWDNFHKNPGAGWQVAGAGDFNGDGKGDILWRGDDGTVTTWLGTADGGFTENWNNFHNNPGWNWQVVATGDFNGDGKGDILWRGRDGTITNWLGTANGGFAGNWDNFHNNPGSNWQVAGTGDFDGDGKSDIFWRSKDGSVTNWLGTANGGFVGNWDDFHANPGTFWHVQDPFG